MGFYAFSEGSIKIEPKLTENEVEYCRKRFYYHIMSNGWYTENNGEDPELKFTEEEESKLAKRFVEDCIKTDEIYVNPHCEIPPSYLEFLKKMFGKRISGEVKIDSLSTLSGVENN